MITLNLGGRVFDGWTAATVTRGLDRLASDFRLDVTDKPWRVVPGDACSVDVDGVRVITGFVDNVAPEYSAHEYRIAVRGRSRTQDLVDCSAENKPPQWANRKLESIARDLCKPFGIDVVVETDTGGPFTVFKVDQGKTVYAMIEELARRRGILATDNAAGDLVLTSSSKSRATTELVLGENVLAARATFSMNRRHSSYTVKAQQPGSDFLNPAATSGVVGRAIDEGVGRHRPLVVVAGGPLDAAGAKEQASNTARVRFGQAAAVVYTVDGWSQASGVLWRPNQVVRVRDTRLRLDRDMLIANVTYVWRLEQKRAEISVIRPEAFERVETLSAALKKDAFADVRKLFPDREEE